MHYTRIGHHHYLSMQMLRQPTGSVQPTGLVHSLSDLVAKAVAFVQVVSLLTSVRQWLRRLLVLYLSVVILPSELRWLRRPSVLSVVSVLSPFGFLISQPPLRHVSVMAEVLYMVERKEDILLFGLRVAARRISVGFFVASVLSPFEFEYLSLRYYPLL